MEVTTPSALAVLLIARGGWPLSEEEAAATIFRYFIGVCDSAPSKKKLMAKLGVVDTKFGFPVKLGEEHAAIHAKAALAELLLLGLAEAKMVGPGAVVGNGFRHPPKPRHITYSRTGDGSKLMVRFTGSVAAALAKEGWP